jgi:NDP-sugar pyrophosphorylase family protein
MAPKARLLSDSIDEGRVLYGVHQYLVKWMDYPEPDSIWESNKNLRNSQELLEKYPPEKAMPDAAEAVRIWTVP